MNLYLQRFPVLLAAAALAAGCTRAYDNPAGELSAGEVGGRVSSPSGAAGAAGTSVSVKGSLLDQAIRPSRRFGALPLPRGPHTVLLRQGVARAAQRQVSMGYGSDGQLEGVWLGEVTLPLAVSLSGALDAVFGGESTDGVVVDEVTGIAVTTAPGGEFLLEGLAVGTHRIVAATRDPVGGTTWIGGPALVEAALSEQGTNKKLADLPLRAAGGGLGHLYFRVASATGGLDPAQAEVHVTDWAGAPVPVPPPDSSGDRDLSLAEGAYFVEVLPPAAHAGTTPPPDRRVAVVVAGDGFDLGTFVLAGDATLSASALSCHTDADCAPGSCAAGLCTGYAPESRPPASVPVCADLAACAAPGTACDLPGQLGGAGGGSCATLPSSTLGVCIPCSTRCSAGGTETLAADPCSY